MARSTGGAAGRIAAIVLAAGRSRRMGDINKLIAGIGGVPMIARSVEAALESCADPVLVVTGHEPDRVAAALEDRPVRFVHNPDYASGLSTSLQAGLAAVPEDAAGAIILLGDMPWVTADTIDRLIAAFDPGRGGAIAVPVYKGRRGNPIVWGRQFFDALQRLTGDVGARHLIDLHANQVAMVDTDDDGVLRDIDCPADIPGSARRWDPA